MIYICPYYLSEINNFFFGAFLLPRSGILIDKFLRLFHRAAENTPTLHVVIVSRNVLSLISLVYSFRKSAYSSASLRVAEAATAASAADSAAH